MVGVDLKEIVDIFEGDGPLDPKNYGLIGPF